MTTETRTTDAARAALAVLLAEKTDAVLVGAAPALTAELARLTDPEHMPGMGPAQIARHLCALIRSERTRARVQGRLEQKAELLWGSGARTEQLAFASEDEFMRWATSPFHRLPGRDAAKRQALEQLALAFEGAVAVRMQALQRRAAA